MNVTMMATEYRMDHEHDASNLEFGNVIGDSAPVLSNVEVAVLLQKQKRQYQERNIRIPEAMTSTLDYVMRFANVKTDLIDITSLEQSLTTMRSNVEQWDWTQPGEHPLRRKLHAYELASLVNLMTTSSDRDEAASLIPSLRRTDKLGERFSDEQIDRLLETVQGYLLGLGGQAVLEEEGVVMSDLPGEGQENTVADEDELMEDDDMAI